MTYSDKPGLEIYQRSASFILNMAVAEMAHNTRLVIGHSISNGFYYDFYCGIPVTQEAAQRDHRENAGDHQP